MHLGHVVVYGKNVFEVAFIREDADYPGKQRGIESSTFRSARLLALYRTEHAKLRMSRLIALQAAFRGPADVAVPVPAHNTERNAFIQLVLRRAGIRRVHRAFEFVFEQRSPAVQQCGRLCGVETQIGDASIRLAHEVILRLLELRVGNYVSVSQCFSIVLIVFNRCFNLALAFSSSPGCLCRSGVMYMCPAIAAMLGPMSRISSSPFVCIPGMPALSCFS